LVKNKSEFEMTTRRSMQGTNSQRRIESAWEKENFNPKELVDATKRIMEINYDDIASLRGWFLKVSDTCVHLASDWLLQQCPIETPSFFVHPIAAGKTRYIQKGPNPPACRQFQSQMVHD